MGYALIMLGKAISGVCGLLPNAIIDLVCLGSTTILTIVDFFMYDKHFLFEQPNLLVAAVTALKRHYANRKFMNF